MEKLQDPGLSVPGKTEAQIRTHEQKFTRGVLSSTVRPKDQRESCRSKEYITSVRSPSRATKILLRDDVPLPFLGRSGREGETLPLVSTLPLVPTLTHGTYRD